MVCSHVFVICVTMFPHLEKDSAFSVFAGLRGWNIIYFPCSVDVPVQQGVGLHCIHHHSVLVIFKMSVLSNCPALNGQLDCTSTFVFMPVYLMCFQHVSFFTFFLTSLHPFYALLHKRVVLPLSWVLHSYRCKTSQLYFTACNLCKVCLTFPV